MALRTHLPAYRQLDKLVSEGKAQLVATPITDSGTTPALVATEEGQVAIITKIVGLAAQGEDTSPGLGDLGDFQGLDIYDENGDLTYEGLAWTSFQRVNALHADDPASPEWTSAVPCVPVVWEPEEPIILPPKHTLRAKTNSGRQTLAGACFACYGYMVDRDTAMAMGFATGSHDLTYKAFQDFSNNPQPEIWKNNTGFRTVLAAGAGTNAIAARPGYCIQLLDVYIRAQPLTAAPATHFVRLIAAADVADLLANPTVVFKAINNNPGDFAEWKFSPGIYLPAGDALWVEETGNPRSSVLVSFRYVPADEVPKDHWWCYREPQLPTPGFGYVGTNSRYVSISDSLTLYYPGIAADASLVAAGVSDTKSTPGTGLQHICEGYAISVQKDRTYAADKLYFSINAGTNASNIQVTGSGLGLVNKMISPLICAGSHNQCISLAVDGLNIPCQPDTGVIRVESTSVGAGGTTTPTAADVDVDEWAVLVWGRTAPTRFGTDHFRGSAS
jgi:hypothetical protein